MCIARFAWTLTFAVGSGPNHPIPSQAKRKAGQKNRHKQNWPFAGLRDILPRNDGHRRRSSYIKIKISRPKA